MTSFSFLSELSLKQVVIRENKPQSAGSTNQNQVFKNIMVKCFYVHLYLSTVHWHCGYNVRYLMMPKAHIIPLFNSFVLVRRPALFIKNKRVGSTRSLRAYVPCHIGKVCARVNLRGLLQFTVRLSFTQALSV